MPKTEVENTVCDACGAEIRSGALFCYNCGVAAAIVSEDISLASTLTAVGPPLNGRESLEPLHEPTAAAPEIAESGKNIERKRLRSASDVRKRTRTLDRGNVKIAWETPEKNPVMFVAATISLALLTALLILLAFYYR